LNAHDCTHHLRARRPVEGDNPYNRTLSHHLHHVTSPAFLIAFLQFIDALDSVLTGGQIASEYYPLLVKWGWSLDCAGPRQLAKAILHQLKARRNRQPPLSAALSCDPNSAIS
jgi:hypothetical protein